MAKILSWKKAKPGAPPLFGDKGVLIPYRPKQTQPSQQQSKTPEGKKPQPTARKA